MEFLFVHRFDESAFIIHYYAKLPFKDSIFSAFRFCIAIEKVEMATSWPQCDAHFDRNTTKGPYLSLVMQRLLHIHRVYS